MRRFAVVEVSGEFYEVERPVGATEIRVCCEITGGRIVHVWLEDASPPPQATPNPFTEDPEEPEWM